MIPAGETTASFEIVPILDSFTEPQETVEATLVAHPSYRAQPGTPMVIIASELGAVSLAVEDDTASEAGPEPGVFTIVRAYGPPSTRRSPSLTPCPARRRVASIMPRWADVGLAPYQTSASFTVAPLADNLAEASEIQRMDFPR